MGGYAGMVIDGPGHLGGCPACHAQREFAELRAMYAVLEGAVIDGGPAALSSQDARRFTALLLRSRDLARRLDAFLADSGEAMRLVDYRLQVVRLEAHAQSLLENLDADVMRRFKTVLGHLADAELLHPEARADR